jgi:Uma2 family endonuclease
MTSAANHEKVDTLCRHRWTVHAFHRLGEAGILDEDARVELIEGELVDMAPAPIGSRHAGTLEKLRHWLERSVQDSALVFSQNPVVLGEHSEPQPDIVLLKPRADFYVHAHPGAADVLLLIEVADSSVEYDRTVNSYLAPVYSNIEAMGSGERLQSLEVQEQIKKHHAGQQPFPGRACSDSPVRQGRGSGGQRGPVG